MISKLFTFAIVGGLGFVVDAGGSVMMIENGGDPFVARILAMLAAMLVTWRLNRHLTFGPSDTCQTTEGARYFTVAVGVAALNFAIYACLLLAFSNLSPLIAIIIATGISMCVSFVGYGRFAFRNAETADEMPHFAAR